MEVTGQFAGVSKRLHPLNYLSKPRSIRMFKHV